MKHMEAPVEIRVLNEACTGQKFSPRVFRSELDRLVEIQYLLDVDDAENIREDLGMIAFAVNSDGHNLLVDPFDPTLSIHQEEFGDVDCIDLSVKEIISQLGCAK